MVAYFNSCHALIYEAFFYYHYYLPPPSFSFKNKSHNSRSYPGKKPLIECSETRPSHPTDRIKNGKPQSTRPTSRRSSLAWPSSFFFYDSEACYRMLSKASFFAVEAFFYDTCIEQARKDGKFPEKFLFIKKVQLDYLKKQFDFKSYLLQVLFLHN